MDKPELARLVNQLAECERLRDAVYSVQLSRGLEHPDEVAADLTAEAQERWRSLDEECRGLEARIALLTNGERF